MPSSNVITFLSNTTPIDLFVTKVKSKKKDIIPIVKLASDLEHSSVFVVGLGLRGRTEGTKCWIYSSDESIPFYRVTNLSRYSPYNVPYGNAELYKSLLCEISYSRYKKESGNTILERTIKGLTEAGIIKKEEEGNIINTWVKRIDYAYPIPTIRRDRILREIQSFIMSCDIYSRGRFGAWKYEIGNMDHSVMMGVEVVNRILCSEKENIWR